MRWKTRHGDSALNVMRETVRTSPLKTRAIANPTAATMKIGRTSLAKIERSSVTGTRS